MNFFRQRRLKSRSLESSSTFVTKLSSILND